MSYGKERSLNFGQVHKHFVPIDQEIQIVQLIFYEVKKWEFERSVSGLVLGKQGGYPEVLSKYLSHIGKCRSLK